MRMGSLFVTAIAACGMASAACNSADRIISDRCFVIIATVNPNNPTMHVADTLMLHAAFTGPAECWPADTTAAALRWSASGSTVRVDSLTGLVTALSGGNGDVQVRGVTTGMLGSTVVNVVAP
jgi:uncharacterized protein YjdB